MFFRFFDNSNSGYLLGHIVSWETKSFSENCHILVLDMEKDKKYLEYSSYENLISDVDALTNDINEYYVKAMSQEQSNEMGYDISACGYEDGMPNEMEEDEENCKLVGFKMEK